MAEEIVVAETPQIESTREVTNSAFAFDTDTRAGKIKLFNALNSAESLSDSHVDRLTLQGLIVQSGNRLDQVTGEITPAKFTTFITESGAYFSQSDGIARSAENLIAAFGDDFASEPLTIEFGTKQLQGGRTMKYFYLVN